MKADQLIFIVVLTIGSAVSSMWAQKPVVKEVSSEVKAVKVFLQGAWVTRQAQTQLPAGLTEVVCKGLPHTLDVQGLRVSGEGAFTLLSVRTSTDYLGQQARTDTLKQLLAQQYLLQREKEVLGVEQALLRQQLDLLDRNRAVAGSQMGLHAEQLQAVLDVQAKARRRILREQLALKGKVRRVDSLLTRVNNQIAATQNRPDQPVRNVRLLLEAEHPTPATIELAYYVPEASWHAVYDLRVQQVGAPVELEMKAGIKQHTGEDWREVQLTLSTGNPQTDFSLPVLQPWYLRPGSRWRAGVQGAKVSGMVLDGTNGQPLIGATVQVPGTAIGTVTDLQGRFDLMLPAEARTITVSYLGFQSQTINGVQPGQEVSIYLQPQHTALEEVAVVDGRKRAKEHPLQATPPETMPDMAEPPVQVQQRATQIEWEVDKPYSIPSDGSMQTVSVLSEKIPAAFEYYSAPRAVPKAWLKAMLTNWSGRHLVAGMANLFYEGSWLGQTLLDPAVATDTLTLSIGQDKAVAVQRELLKEKVRKRRIGSKRIVEMFYRIEVRNNKNVPITIVLEDQVPLSGHEEIEVALLESEGAHLEPNTGLLRWRLELPAGARKELTFGYKVTYPKWMQLNLE